MALSSSILDKIKKDTENKKNGITEEESTSKADSGSESSQGSTSSTLSDSIRSRIEFDLAMKRQGIKDTGLLGGSGYEDYYKAASSVDGAYINKFLSDWNSYASQAQSAYSGLGWQSATSGELDSLFNDTGTDLLFRSAVIRSYLDKNKDSLDEETYNSFIDQLESISKFQNEIGSTYTSAKDFYSQWETEDDYNKYLSDQKAYEDLVNFDVSAGQKELEELERKKAELESSYLQPGSSYLTGGTTSTSSPYAAAQQQNPEYDEELAELRALISEKTAYMNQAQRIQEGIRLASAVNNPDFNQYSGYNSTEADNWWDKAWSQYSMGYNDLTYEYINGGQNDMRSEIINKAIAFNADNSLDGTDKWKIYDRMTDDEISIYNYYYAKEGKEAAEKYLDSIQETLNHREATSMYENMEGNTFLEYVFGVAAGLDQFESGMKGAWQAITGEDDYIPVSATQMASGMVREDLGDVGPNLPDWLGGASLGQAGYDTVTTTANMVPSIMTSTVLNAVAPGSGAVVGAGMMGASAAGNAYQEMLNLGYTKDQSRAYSALVGASEAGLQYLLGGIGELGGKLSGNVLTKMMNGVDNAFLRTAIKLGGNMFSEGLEEGLQEILTPWFQNLIMYADEDVNWSEVAYSSLLGALTAGFMEGGSTISGEVNTYKTGKQLQEAGISAQSLAEFGGTLSADSVAYQLAERVDENTGAYTTGRLFNEIGATVTEQNIADIQSNLVSKGMSESSANTLAEAIAAVVENPDAVTKKQTKALEANAGLVQAVIEEISDANSTVYQRTQGYSRLTEAAQQAKTGAESAKGQVDAETQNVAQTAQGASAGAINTANDVSNANSALDNATGKEGLQVAEDGVTRQKSTGKEVTPKKIVSIEGGKVMIQTDSGTVAADDIEFGDTDTDLLWRSAVQLNGINTAGANGIIHAYQSGQSVATYLHGATQEFQNGYYNMGSGGKYADKLTPTQREIIYKLGQKAAGENTAKAQAKATEAKKAAAKESSGTVSKKERVGKVHFERNGRTFDAVRETALKTMEQLSAALGVEFYVYESYVNEAGKRVYLDANGNEVHAPNGFYDPKDSSIHIDLNAGVGGKGTMLFTIAHELTHFINEWSPAKFKVLANFLVKQYAEKGISVDTLVENQIKKAKKNGREIGWDEAYEEVVADSMEAMLTDGNVVQMMADLKQQDRGLWQKICGWFKDLVAELKAVVEAYKGVKPDSPEGKMVADMQDVIVILESLYADALVDAGENFQATKAQKNTTQEGGADGNKYSIREGMTDQERYEELRHKQITVISDSRTADYSADIASLEALETKAKSKAEKIIKPLAKKLGIINTPLSTTDVETTFLFTTSQGLSESLHKQLRYGGSYVDFAKTLINLDNVLKSAILIESHGDKYSGTNRADEHLEAVYVLFSAFRDGKTIIPVQMEIKKSSDIGGRLYLTVAMTKIEAGVVGSTPGENQARSLLPASEYNLADIFSKINPQDGHFLKYLPDGFLNKEQIQAKKKAIGEDEARIAGYKKGEASTQRTLHAVVNSNEDAAANGNLSNGDPAKKFQATRPFAIEQGSLDENVAQDTSNVKEKFSDRDSTYAEIEEERQKLYQREIQLQERKREAGNSPELLQAMDDYSNLFTEMRGLLSKKRNGTATQAELDRIAEIKELREKGMERITELQESLGLNAIAQEEAEIRETKEALRVASDAAWAREGAEKENKAIEKAGVSAAEYFRKKALKAFKTTTNFNEAGYLLPDGKLLNFSGGERNHRYRDHREIGEIYEATQGAAALNRFLNDGNIRIMAESPGADLASSVEPTKEQYDALRRFINSNGVKDGQFFVDFSDADGRRAGNYSYQGRVNADRVINDIKHYYATGEIREQSSVAQFLYSDRDSDGNTLSQEQQEYFKDSKVRDEQGRLLAMYHGTPNGGFTKFRSGTYFTQNPGYADVYQNPGASSISTKKGAAAPMTYKVYLDIKKPFDTRNAAERNIFMEEFYRQYGTGTPLADSGLPDWVDGMDLQEFIEEMEYDYDGLILDEGGVGGYGDEVVSRGLSYVVFDPAQVKNVDNKTPTSNPDIRYSDRDYMEAVNTGDTETAQKMVDEAAKAAGYTIKAYHGTTNRQEKSSWNPKTKSWDTEYSRITVFKRQYAEQVGHFFNSDMDNAGGYGSDLYAVYIMLKKPLVIDCGGQNYASITYGGKEMGTYEWAEYAKQHRYDGVVFENISDGVGFDDLSKLTTDYVVFDSNRIKSAEPVTYDNQGNVIPLSRRFDVTSRDIRFSERDPELEKVNRVLTKENTELKYDIAYLKELLKLQKQATGGTKFTKSSVEAAAGQLMKYANAKGNKTELAGLLTEVYEYIAKGEELTWEGVKEAAQPAVEWLQSHVRTEKQKDSYAQDILRQIRGSRIYLDEMQKKEAAYQYGSYNEFRKKTMGSVTIANTGISLDSQWQEWASMYPDIFDAEITTNDMPGALMDVIDRLRNMNSMDSYGYDQELFSQELLRQVYDSYWDVSTLYTVADKAQKEINKLKNEHRSRMAALRKYHGEQTAQLKREHKEDLQKVRQEYRERMDKKLQETQQRYQESRKKSMESRKKTEMRRKIRRTIMDLDKLLNRGNKKLNVKADMQDMVTQALRSADILFTDTYTGEDMVRDGVGTEMTEQEAKYMAEAREILEQMGSGGAEGNLQGKLDYRLNRLKDVFTRERARLNKTKVSEVLGSLADAYASLENSEYNYVSGAFDENVHQYLTMLKAEVGGTTVKDMSLNQLNELHKAYTMVLTTVRNANKMFAANMKQTREQLGSQTIAEVQKAGGEHGLWRPGEDKVNAFSWNNQKPVYAFERIGSATLSKLFENTRAGEDSWAKDMTEAREYYLEQNRKYKFDGWEFDKQYKFTSTSGIDFTLNLEQIMSLYAYSKREQAHDHLMKGGFVFDGNTEVQVNKMGIKVTYLNKTAKAHNVSPEILGEITSKLTAEQRAFVDEMQDYLSTTMGAKGNEVSMQMYGVELFKEKHYFPLRSAGQYMERAKEADLKKQQGQVSIANSGFTKSTTPKSSNPVVLSGFMDVWADHVNEMSMYHSFVLPMEDFRRVYNYSSPNMETGQSVSVNSVIQDAYGKEVTDYIDQLYRDLNGGAVSDPRETPAKALMGKFKKAAVFASISVTIQQPSAIGRAFAIIDPKYFIGRKVDSKRHKALWAELKQYAPVATIKEMGYFDTGMGKSAQDFIKGKEYNTLKEKAAAIFTDGDYRDELLSKAPALADELTWCTIWEAAKRETKAKNPGMKVTSEEFLQLAGKRFTEVITKTQVYDSVLARSANMRSKGAFMNMWTAFMAEPTTTINMVEDALRKGKRGNRKYAARAMGAVLTSVILNSALVSLVYAMRDDDEDETFLEKYVQSFATEILDGINPLTYYPFLKDIWSALQGFDIERSDMSLITSLTEALTKLVQVYSKDTDGMDEEEEAAYNKSLSDAWWGVVDYATALAGIPVKNVRRDINGALNVYKTITADLTDRDTSWGSLLDKTWDDVKNSIPVVGWLPDETAADKLYKATVSGDTAYQKRLSSAYATQTALDNAIRKGLRANDSRIWEAAIAWNNNDLETYKRIAKEIIGEGHFSQDNVVMAIQAEAKSMLETQSSDTESKAKGLFTAEKFAVAISQGNDTMASTIKADIVETAQKNGKTAEEAEASFASSAKSNLEGLFQEGDITSNQAINALVTYCGYTQEKATETVTKWRAEKETGIAYADIDDAVMDGKISYAEAKNMYITYGGYSEEDAAEKVTVLAFVKKYPECDGISYSAVENYQTYCEASGVPAATFYDAWKYNSSTSADVDANGKSISGSKKAKVLAYINSLDLTYAQKDSMYYAFGWAASTIGDAPWH